MTELNGEVAEELLNLILDEVDDIIIIYDSDLRVVWMNRAAQKKFGQPLDSLLGKKCYKLFGHRSPCEACGVQTMIGGPSEKRTEFKFSDADCVNYKCKPIAYYKDNKLELIIQHMTCCCKND